MVERIGKLLGNRSAFDVAIVMHPGQELKSAAILYAAGIKTRIGATYPLFHICHSSLFLTNGVALEDNIHDVEKNLRLVAPLIPPVKGDKGGLREQVREKFTYAITVQEEFILEAENLLISYNIPVGKKLIGIHPGCAKNFLWKRWPKENFIELSKILIEKYNAHILIFGGPGEIDMQKEIHSSIPNQSSIVQTSLLTTAALMQKCKVVVSNDSGLMHLSAATGTPTIGLFGPTDENKTGPRGQKSIVVRAPGTKPVYNTHSNFNLGNTPHTTIIKITVDMVMEKIRSTLS